MENYRIRPKGDYIQQTDWNELFVLTKHWKSDLMFYKQDLDFLHGLLKKYFIWITKEENLDVVKEIGKGILNDKKTGDILLQRVEEHLTHIAQTIEDPFKYDTRLFRKEHQQLEDDIAAYYKTVRQNRKKVFAITSYIVDSESLQHLL
ncbi:hypothetical protein [Maribacter polysaccharolyticus]|uniref:hypothetical protein n=1 Tax=Maribacter polysaccharolyticus TaxID=3020831 RepID=UPI00237F9A51|nr:hypothetical protein [Maribacter polysaccharolyticus]MDE3740851.1 hypothetical protein [Maribacter polysaccharolyticus]